MICKYDEAFSAKEMLEETGLCKDCKQKCPMAGKTIDSYKPINEITDLDELNVYVKIAMKAMEDRGYVWNGSEFEYGRDESVV